MRSIHFVLISKALTILVIKNLSMSLRDNALLRLPLSAIPNEFLSAVFDVKDADIEVLASPSKP